MYSQVNVVCFGGGTGLPSLLSGLKHNPWFDITAVVNMFDTGGSSGELRDRFGILPPGDILKCLLALSHHESYARDMLQKRIRNHDTPGHTGGNALLLGFQQIYGSHLAAVDALGQLLSIRGKVVPVTSESTTLCARYTDGSTARGETSIDLGIHEGKVLGLLLLEPEAVASSQALAAIQKADVLCIGPGSFWTSVVPNFLPNGITAAIKASHAKIIYIANLLTEGKGMRGMDLMHFVSEVEGFIRRPVDWVVMHEDAGGHEEALEQYVLENKYPVRYPTRCHPEELERRCVRAQLWNHTALARHDPSRLAHLVAGLINRCIK